MSSVNYSIYENIFWGIFHNLSARKIKKLTSKGLKNVLNMSNDIF